MALDGPATFAQDELSLARVQRTRVIVVGKRDASHEDLVGMRWIAAIRPHVSNGTTAFRARLKLFAHGVETKEVIPSIAIIAEIQGYAHRFVVFRKRKYSANSTLYRGAGPPVRLDTSPASLV